MYYFNIERYVGSMDFVTKVKTLLTALRETSSVSTVICSVLGALVIGSVGIGGFNLYEHFYGPEAMVSAEVNTEINEIETEEVFSEVTEVVEETEEIVPETETETETEEGPVPVKLVGSSIEKDLKIKIQNEEGRNVRGEDFHITVTPDKRNAITSTYKDHDNDGIIYIVDIDGGDYIVALEEIDGYYTEKESVKVTVKEHIEYVKVEVKDEIKTEAEVSPEEDAEIKNEVEVEAEIKDTVPWLDSKVIATAVDAATIDKTPYVSGVASLGANCAPITVPKGETPATVSYIFRKFLIVRTGLSTETPSTEVLSNENPITETPGSQVPGTEEPSTQVPDTEEPSTQVPDTETSGTQVPSTETPSTQTPSQPALNATVAMPTTAQLFISTRTAANTIDIAVAIDDKNATKVVNEAGIKWAVANDTTGDGVAGNGLTVVGSGKAAKITAAASKKEGTATVTAEIPYTNTTTGAIEHVTLSCAVTVIADSYDPTIALEDGAGELLFVDETCSKEATVADLMEKDVTTFYKNPKYQGWQALGGKLYYFNENNQPVTGEQTICGMIYNFEADGSLAQNTTATGIDVSKYQTNVDWNTVKASGIEFVIIRVGYRGSATGVLVEDPYFKQHIKGATDAGLKVGVYFFTQAITKAEAVEEASMALALTEGYNLAYPIFIDTERVSGNARANNLDKATRTEIVDAFCKTIQSAGRKAGIYASKSWYNNQLDVSKLNDYYIWVAQYNTECTYTGRYDIWQYTETGNIPGITGNVDLNISYMH